MSRRKIICEMVTGVTVSTEFEVDSFTSDENVLIRGLLQLSKNNVCNIDLSQIKDCQVEFIASDD